MGVAAGYRWATTNGKYRYNLIAYYYQRNLVDSAELNGTIYGGDRDFFEFSELFFPGPIDPNNDLASIPLSSKDKKESGVTFWYYGRQSTLFAQLIAQDIAGLERWGAELELSHRITTKNKPLIRGLVSAVCYSILYNDIVTPPLNPAPSIGWDWQKLDIGLTVFFKSRISLIME